MKYKNLIEILIHQGKEDRCLRFIDKHGNEISMSYQDLYRNAAGLLAHLQNRGLKPGDQLVFQLDNNKDFILYFWACLLGSITPVPVTVGTVSEFQLKLFNIWSLLNHPYLVTTQKHLKKLKRFALESNRSEMFNHIKRRGIFVEEIEPGEESGKIRMPAETDIAYIQFSSGSTGEPKGIVLTHKNLVTNINANIIGLEYPPSGIDRYLSWMPLTHDMGLIGFHLTPLAPGWEQTLMAPQLFIRYPHLWLQKMSELKSTLTVSPNFGYRYVLKHFDPLKNQDLDLSAVRIIVNGAEPISLELCNEFINTMAPFGLRKNAIFPAYGLAEASLAVCLTSPERELVAAHLDRGSLKVGEKVRITGGHDPNAVSFVEVGTPVQDCSVKIVNTKGRECEDLVVGEILIKGDNVTAGYYNNSEATSRVITPDGWLRTGDLGFFNRGHLVITGRAKEVIFANGQNFYPHDLERSAEDLADIEFEKVAACGIFNPKHQGDEIVCFVVFRKSLQEFLSLATALKNHIMEKMALEVSHVIPVKKIPKTTSGKIQRTYLKTQYLEGKFDTVLEELGHLQRETIPASKWLSQKEIKRIVTETWCEVLKLEHVGENENFFDIGGTSAYALQIKGKLQTSLGKAIEDTAVFRYPTISTLTDFLSTENAQLTFFADQKQRLDLYCKERIRIQNSIKQYFARGTGKDNNRNGLEIAVIGMSGRFPGAANIHEFWENLKNGIESISFFSDDELIAGGVGAQMLENSNYVKAKGILTGIEYFDAAFFGYTPLETQKMDPQVRVFHECLWQALADASYTPEGCSGLIGVYAGASPNHFWDAQSLLAGRIGVSEQITDIHLNDKDFMATRASYKLSLKGPSFTIYTACSTSLVAVDLACQGLLTGKCDMALAGGVSIWMPHKIGYLYEESMLFSRDGHNRTFDARANGTIFSDGAAIVVLKRLADALVDRDHIYALIKASAVNNDGDRKVGYTAPAVEGQAEVIAAAQQMAGVEPASIGYLEAHGTATTQGDPIELDALKLVFNTPGKHNCAIGSVKSNIGHINAAAGVVGLIKTIMVLKHRLIPPAIHYENPNPRIDFENSPFYINTRLKEWKTGSSPRRAGISSFGIGGTNSHVILEEAPKIKESSTGKKWKLVMLSACTPEALENTTGQLLRFLEENPGINLADAAYTLHVGRRHFQHRRMLACRKSTEAIEALSIANSGPSPTLPETIRALSASVEKETMNRPVIFMFSGLGSQYVNMGLELYREEPVFQQQMDRCFEILESLLGEDLKCVLYPDEFTTGSSWQQGAGAGDAAEKFKRTKFIQPIVFTFGYALAQLLITWGIKPHAVIGYSFGEYIAACTAGIFSLQDALKLVVARAQLVEETPEGTMISVPLTREQIEPLADNRLSIAVDNGPSCIVAGPRGLIDTFEQQMKDRKYLCMRVETGDALHSALMDPILKSFQSHVEKVKLNEPQIPFISNLSGTWAIPREVAAPAYWIKQLRQTVQFAPGIRELLKIENAIFVEVGAGVTVSTIVRQFTRKESKHMVINLVQHPQGKEPDTGYLLNKIGRLWLYGININWLAFYSQEKRSRISLPSCPFHGQYYPFADRGVAFKSAAGNDTGKYSIRKKPDISDWFYISLWKQSAPITPIPPGSQADAAPGKYCNLVFLEGNGFGSRLLEQWQVEEDQQDFIVLRPGTAFNKVSESQYTINPRQGNHYELLFRKLRDMDRIPGTIVHLWCLPLPGYHRQTSQSTGFARAQVLGFYSLIHMTRALEHVNHNGKNIEVIVVTDGLWNITGTETLEPANATVLAPIITINQEYRSIRCRNLDITLPEPGQLKEKKLIRQLLAEFRQDSDSLTAAYRNGYRWERTFEKVKPVTHPGDAAEAVNPPRLRKNGVCLITGGLGGIGFLLAKDLAQRGGAKLILTGRTSLPPRQQWNQWLAKQQNPDPISDKLHKVRELESLGAEVLVFGADAANREEMEQVIKISEKKLGPINGVIHAAGIVGEKSIRLINEINQEDCEEQFQAKVGGLFTLGKIFRHKALDFCILMSSISSVLGGLGLTAYAAANLFMDAFVEKYNRSSPCSWLSINWDMWQLEEQRKRSEFIHWSLEELSMEPAEGITAFHRALTWSGSSQLVISTGDLPQRHRHWVALRKDKAMSPPAFQDKPAAPDTSSAASRPNILGTYVAPRSQLETMMSQMLQENLGIKKIGIHDNFFELGATSLELIRVNNQLNEALGVKIPLVKLLTYTSIASFAGYYMKEVMGKDSSSKSINRSDAVQKGKASIKQKLTKKKKRRLN